MRRRELQGARARLGLSQAKLAKALGIHRSAVAKYEGGLLPVPKVVALAVAYLETRAATPRKSA